MPLRELKHPHQVEDWLIELGRSVTAPGRMTLIGSGALLWHAARRGITTPLPESSMDVDPITDSDEVARLCYEAVIGSDFERTHGWHINLMPDTVLREFPAGWTERAVRQDYGLLQVTVPAPTDLLVPKLRRGEPRDHTHAAWAKSVNLV